MEQISETVTPEKVKIINFPKKHADQINGMPLTEEESKTRITDYKSGYNIECAEMIYEHVILELSGLGFINTADKTRYNENDYVLLFEAIKSIMDRYQRLDNGLHQVVDDLFIREGEDTDEGDELIEE